MKAFLSHSSRDKRPYVETVHNKLGDRSIYDEYNFDSGMKTLSEIMRGINASDVFVLFISESSLNSEWVRNEIIQAKFQIDQNKIKNFLPILIDKSIKYDDPRIPSWIHENYNLRYVAKPTSAFR
jgi:hypothetical protein